MAIKSFQAKLVCDTPPHRDYLQITHRLFNEHVPPILSILYAARRGDHGPEYQQILSTVKGAQGAKEQVEAISSPDAKPGEGGKGDWKPIARSLLQQKRILFDRQKLLPGFSSEFRRKVFETSFQIILSHQANLSEWREQHEQWLAQKAQWEAEHQDYLRIRPAIEEFSKAEGMVAKRRGRWHRWLAFLSSHPDLAAWKGAPPAVNPLTPADFAQAKKNPRKMVSTLFALFWKKNPELEALDRSHGEYERKFIRPWAKRRHSDGFRHPPTLTLPSPDKHPAWFSFKKNETYRHLDLSAGTIDLKVITSADPATRSPKGYTTYHFRPDQRLRHLRPAPQPILSGRVNCDLVHDAVDALPPRPACIQGAKLVFKDAQPYLYFSVYIEDMPSRLSLMQKSFDKYSPQWVSQKVRKDLPDPPITMAIDLGIRQIAAATIMQAETLKATRFLHNRATSPLTGRTIDGIPTLGQIAAMKRNLRRSLRKRGKPVQGQLACKRLQNHVRRMSEDRFKKSAKAIIDLARFHKVDIILLEKLAGLVPDAERERGINRSLINWNRGQMADWIKMLAPEYGLRTLEVPPYWTSQICHRCNHVGYRYSITEAQPHVEPVGKLFCCPHCAYRCNADFNASINLHRVFLGSFPETRSKGDGKLSLNGQEIDLKAVRAAVEALLAREYLAQETPF